MQFQIGDSQITDSEISTLTLAAPPKSAEIICEIVLKDGSILHPTDEQRRAVIKELLSGRNQSRARL